MAELSAMTGVHRDSASKVINKFLKWNVLVRTTKGKMDFYRLNSDEPLVISISAMNDALDNADVPRCQDRHGCDGRRVVAHANSGRGASPNAR